MRLRGLLNLITIFLLCLVTTSGASAWANDEIEDIEHVPTPTQLADLLPAGGIHAIDIGFWLIWSSPDEQGKKRDSLYMNWTIEQRVGLLYVEHIYGSDRGGRHGAGFHYRKRFKYHPDGTLKSYYADLQLGGGDRQTINGEIRGDALVLATVHRDRWLVLKPTTTERMIALSRFDQAVPVEWMPLIIAYHIRRGSLGYEVETMEFATGEIGYTRVEDMGTEVYRYGAQIDIAHFLGIEIDVKRSGSHRKETMKLLTARDGNYFQFFNPNTDTSVRRSTIDEVGEIFNVQKADPNVFNRFSPAAYYLALLE